MNGVLESLINTNAYSKDEVVVLEKNENSDLINDMPKPCTQEFFEKLFSPSGEFWTLYNEVGLSFKPKENEKHVVFVDGQMFFCKNFERKYLKNVGPKTEFNLLNNRLAEKKPFNFDNLMLLLASPFDYASLTTATALAPLKLNEYFSEFKEFQKETIETFEKSKNLEPLKQTNFSLTNALKAMKYSFAASLAFTLKAIPNHEVKEKACEQDEYAQLSTSPPALAKRFPFHSKEPYDISKPRFLETLPESTEPTTTVENAFMRFREDAKFVCSRWLCLERIAYQKIAQESGLGEDVFYLHSSELREALENPNHLLEKIQERKKQTHPQLPRKIAYYKHEIITLDEKNSEIRGVSAGAQKTVTAQCVEINSEEDYSKNIEGRIILTKTLPPNTVSLYGKAAGIVSAGGGVLSHASIVAREKNLACITATKNFKLLKEGQTITINGKTGEIKIEKN